MLYWCFFVALRVGVGCYGKENFPKNSYKCSFRAEYKRKSKELQFDFPVKSIV